MKITPLQKNKGFTLVEMLVSIALFTIVLVVILSSILTVIDVSRKSQSLAIVMNDMNFVLENITRSVKTGSLKYDDPKTSESRIIVEEDLDGEVREIEYYFFEVGSKGKIFKKITVEDEEKSDVSITSDNIDIDKAVFSVYAGSTANRQPRVLISVKGTAKLSERVSSEFNIQTSVSQRNYDLLQLND